MRLRETTEMLAAAHLHACLGAQAGAACACVLVRVLFVLSNGELGTPEDARIPRWVSRKAAGLTFKNEQERRACPRRSIGGRRNVQLSDAVEPYDQNIVTFEAMFTGYTQAFTRFHGAAVDQNAAAAFIPLFEALNWAAALDWRIGAHWTPDGGEPLRDCWPARLGDADLVYGVRLARNSIHHQWSDALHLDKGARFPIRFPMAFFEWVWRPASELPPPEPGRKKDEKGETVYRAKLEGHPARHTLEELGGIFEKMRGFLEPWLLRRQPEPPVVTTD